MSLAFWRRDESPSQAGRASEPRRPDSDAQSPEALRTRTRRRLIGAAALLLATVIGVPMLLDGDRRPVPDRVTVNIPPENTPFEPSVQPAANTPPPLAVPPLPLASPTEAPAEPGEVPSEAPPRADRPASPAVAKSAAHGVTGAAAAAPSPSQTPAARDRYALQTAALSNENAARDLAARLKKAGFSSYVEPVKTSAGIRHRVRVGPFPSEEEAKKVRERMRAAGYPAAVVGA
jgi:DedD protein